MSRWSRANGKLTLDTPLVMSARAARMPPSKMGFRPGTEVTLDNALKMLMVKSPNDVAVMVAEGVSGSVEGFADDMNAGAQRLGLRKSHFVNPNGLHDPAHVSSARDMAMIARALLREFPEHANLFSIGALQLGNQYVANHNGLLGRYPGADGMKTGFTCPAGFNVVASANHSGRRLIVVVLGAPTARSRNQEAANLFDRGFAMGGGSGSLESLPRRARSLPICAPTSACAETRLRSTPPKRRASASDPSQVATATGRGAAFPTGSAALIAPDPGTVPCRTRGSVSNLGFASLSRSPPPGWKGPALAALARRRRASASTGLKRGADRRRPRRSARRKSRRKSIRPRRRGDQRLKKVVAREDRQTPKTRRRRAAVNRTLTHRFVDDIVEK